MGACLASTLIAVAYLAPASNADDTGEASKTIGFASLLFEGSPKGATYHLDEHTLNIISRPSSTTPVVVKSGHHVIEVRKGERVLLHEEVTLEPNETRTLRIPKTESDATHPED
jgi:hypothetical protein